MSSQATENLPDLKGVSELYGQADACFLWGTLFGKRVGEVT